MKRIITIALLLAVGGCFSLSPFQARSIIKSQNDSREFRQLELENGMKVLLVRDSGEATAAASLNVAVGSRFDPPQQQGLAHLLEHMLFLGTQKYPTANSYQLFVGAHGGSHNAYTSFDQTNYFFDIQNAYLDEALDRFADFFVAPKFDALFVEREINAVEAEYRSKILDESRRIIDATRAVANPRHPFSQFSVGAIESLDTPSLRQDLMAFYREYYSANRMTLAVVADYPLDTLEQMVMSRFSNVASLEHQVALIDEPIFVDLPSLLVVETKKPLRSLLFAFPLPDVKAYATMKPLDYIANLLGDEGAGSLLSFLKRRGLVEALSAGSGMRFEGGALFQVSMDLTANGMQAIDEIGEALFRTIENIESELMSAPKRARRRYREQRELSDIAFRFYQQPSPLSAVIAASSNLHYYPLSSVIYGPYQYSDFSAPAIQLFLSNLTPDNAFVTVASDKVASEYNIDSTSYWYNTHFGTQPLPKGWLEQWRALPQSLLVTELALPNQNKFIPNDFIIYDESAVERSKSKIGNPMNPQIYNEGLGYRLWLKKDNQFKQPKVTLDIALLTPTSERSLENQVMSQLLSLAVADALTEKLYPAFLAGYGANFRAHLRGFTISVGGYSDSALDVATYIVTALNDFSMNAKRFNELTAGLSRRWLSYSQSNASSLLAKQLTTTLLEKQWSYREMLDALEKIDIGQLESFARTISKKSYVEALLHGNINGDMMDKTVELLDAFASCGCHYGNGDSYIVDENVVDSVQVLPRQQSAQDNAVLWYFPAPSEGLRDTAVAMLARDVLHPMFYDELRTQAQLGYVVGIDHRRWYRRSGLAFWVQSPQSSVTELKAAMVSFIDRRLAQGITDQAEFNKYREALIVELSQDDSDLVARSQRFWHSLALNDDDFDRKTQLLSELKSLDLAGWRAQLLLILDPESPSMFLSASP